MKTKYPQSVSQAIKYIQAGHTIKVKKEHCPHFENVLCNKTISYQKDNFDDRFNTFVVIND